VSTGFSHKVRPSLRRFSRQSQTPGGIAWRLHPTLSGNVAITYGQSLMAVIEPIFTKLRLTKQNLVRNTYTEFHENSTLSLVTKRRGN
jgi:hypothetical protein